MGPVCGAEEQQGDRRGVTLLQVRTKGRRSLHEAGEEGGLGNLLEGVLTHLLAQLPQMISLPWQVMLQQQWPRLRPFLPSTYRPLLLTLPMAGFSSF